MRKPRILVVEDEGIIAKDLCLTLEKLGYEVSAHAMDGEEAVQKALEFKPDLVLMDIMLWGGMDGIEAAVRIREQIQVPIIYLTAHSDTTTLQRAQLTGPHGYLVKPIVEQELHTSIETALCKQDGESQPAESKREFTGRRMADGALGNQPPPESGTGR